MSFTGFTGFRGFSGFTMGSYILTPKYLLEMNTFSVVDSIRTIDNTDANILSGDTEMFGSNAVYMNGVDQYAMLDIEHQLGNDVYTGAQYSNIADNS